MRAIHGTTKDGKPATREGVPRIHWDGEDGDYYIMATDLMGPSLEDLLTYCRGKLSLKTTLLIAEQALRLLRCLHKAEWLHRDVKPDNFVMGTGRDANNMYVIDMGVAVDWNRAELAYRFVSDGERSWVGTPEYAPLRAHERRGAFFFYPGYQWSTNPQLRAVL